MKLRLRGLLLVAAALAATPAPASAAACRLEKIAGVEKTLEQRVVAGEGGGWLIRRREPSARDQSRMDGVLLLSPGSSLRMKAVRRRDGDQRFLLGGEGQPPEPVEGWAELLPQLRRERLAGYRLVSPEGGELALVLVPHGATVICVDQEGAARIEIRRPEEDEKNRFNRDPARPLF